MQVLTVVLGLMYLGDYTAVEPGCYMTIANWLNCKSPRLCLAHRQTRLPGAVSILSTPILMLLRLSKPVC